MNIFYLHPNPVKAASYFYDKHKVKMILECAQMLCTAHHVYDNGDNVPYKKAHLNHPSTIWVRESIHHYNWLYEHMLAIGKEYTARYNKYHMSIEKCREALAKPPVGMPDNGFTEPPQCMPEEYKVSDNSLLAYWNYYEQEKQNIRNKNEQKIIRPSNINELCKS